MTRRIIASIAAIGLTLGAPVGMPAAAADPVALPAMTPTNSGPIIGGGGAAQQMSQQLKSFGDPNVQEVDGSDAAQFITAAAAVTNRDLASPFLSLQRGLGCQTNNAGFGARAYRRKDGQWGGAMLVVTKSSVPSVDALTACAKANWRRPTAGGPNSMCNGGWTYPPQTFSNRGGGETYFVMLAGTASDFCTTLDGNYRTNASGWPN
jgi:hypothetical protein